MWQVVGVARGAGQLRSKRVTHILRAVATRDICLRNVASSTESTGSASKSFGNRNVSRRPTRIDSPSRTRAGQQVEQKPASILISEIVKEIGRLNLRISQLERLLPIWSAASVDVDPVRLEVLEDARRLVKLINSYVEKGPLKPRGKHQHEISVLMERIMHLYSQAASTDGVSVFDECMKLLAILDSWNIDHQSKHIEYAVTAAAREERWEDASNLFWSHIDPEEAGFAPFAVDITSPVGLYSIARRSQARSMPVVEPVFDGVLKMCMVSPSDQDKCKLNLFAETK
jgi:hypothetical protein